MSMVGMGVKPGDWGVGKGEPVPRHKRSSRRAYDPEGREIEPATVANVVSHGAAGLFVLCFCGHEGRIEFHGIDPATYVPDIALRLACSACGARGSSISVMPDWTKAGRYGVKTKKPGAP